MKLNEDFIKVHRDAALTGVGVGFKILIARYFYRLNAVVAVRALCTYLYYFIYLGDLKL